MMSKSSKSTRFDPLLPGTLALAVLLASTSAFAQTPGPGSANTTIQPTGYVRFWNMLSGKTAPSMQLLATEDKVLTTATSCNSTANYVGLTPGTYTFVVRKQGDTANPLKRVAVVLRASTYVTFLVSEKNGQPVVDLLDDTPDPKKADAPSQLVIRQFMPAARVTVSTREGATSREVGFGETATLDNLPNRDLFLIMKATGLGPETKVWNTDADFTAARHATLLVVPDSYGRFRPRLSYDGQNGAVPDATPPPTPKP